MRRLIVRALLVVALVAAAGVGTLAATRTATNPAAPTIQSANAAAKAEPAPESFADVVSVVSSRDLGSGVAAAATGAANAAGAASVVTESATLGLVQVLRNGQVVQATPAGYRWGLATSALPTDATGRVMSRQVAVLNAAGQVVMGATTAALHGVQAGDEIDVLNAANQPVRLRVGLVGSDALVGGTELVMNVDQFHFLGFVRPSRVLIWGIPDRKALDAALAGSGLNRPDVRVTHSWDPPSPDNTLSTAATKAKLGEFAYAYQGAGPNITPEAAWRAANIARFSWPVGGGAVSTFCHRVVAPAAQAALAEVSARGLGGAIDLVNTNTYGGCYGPREVRPAGGTTGGSVSRHSWGQAIDMNTAANCMGCVPQMNCTVVQIFRKYGFAWGGNFLSTDGMHFEWVGERRDQLNFPVRYCPNVAGATQSTTPDVGGRPAPLPPAPTANDSRDRILVEPSAGDLD